MVTDNVTSENARGLGCQKRGQPCLVPAPASSMPLFGGKLFVLENCFKKESRISQAARAIALELMLHMASNLEAQAVCLCTCCAISRL